MVRKSFNEKLHGSGDLPKIVDLAEHPKAQQRMHAATMLVAAPLQYQAIIARIPAGAVTTSDRIREHLAAQAGADVTCQITAGIFINLCAHASEERDAEKIPWWRALKTNGELNEKYPGGINAQRRLLEGEGHTVVQRGKRSFVDRFEEQLCAL
jgi:alkylated DNA nucleotide flippase Atl1